MNLPRRLLAGLGVALGCAHLPAQNPLPPAYADRTNLLFYQNGAGQLQPVKTPADWARRVAHVRANMELVMGPLPAPTTVPLDVKLLGETRLRNYTRQHVTFAVEAGDRLPGFLLVPDGASARDKRPAMICLPGSGAPGKDNPAGLSASSPGMAYAAELAARGYVCLVLDYPLLHTAEYPTDPYAMNYVSATMKGIVNHRRGVDLLASLAYVDAGAIGVIGHSLGGHNALFLAVFDERVKAIVSSCGFNVFAKHNHGDVRAWSSRYYMPRIKTVYGDDPAKIPFDFTEVLAALAPRAVFVNAPLHDVPDFEVSGVRDCLDAALPVYRTLFNAADRLVARHPDAGHSFPAAERQAAYAFLDRHLERKPSPVELQRDLVAHWPLAGNAQPVVGGGTQPAAIHGTVQWDATRPAAVIQGRDTWLEVPAEKAPRLGPGDFSVALWMQSDDPSDVLPGDLISQYDPLQRRGFHLTLKSNPGVTSNQSNWRHLQFGIDDNRISDWTDCGRPGTALFAFALATHDGALFAGTCETGKADPGRVYRYAGAGKWIDCGAPDRANSVTSFAVYNGELYAGTGKYRIAGSALAESENTALGGRVFRYAGRDRWVACGQLPGTEAVGGLVVFQGKLYASSLYQPAGFFRYEGGTQWTACPVPVTAPMTIRGIALPAAKRIVPVTVHDGYLYGGSYDGGNVYRFDGTQWEDLGLVGTNTQTYSFTRYQGRLHAGTWPSGRVYRLEDSGRWTDLGRLGEELEVMGMVVHNGRLLAGTLPLAEIYSFDYEGTWRRLARLDPTPEVRYRRAWTMAEHDGEVFVSTLPSGKVFSFSAGQQATWGHSLSAAWHHVVAVKSGQRLTLYLDGERVSQSPDFEAAGYNLNTDAPLRIGAGANGTFNGRLAGVRIYRRTLNAAEIEQLATPPPTR